MRCFKKFASIAIAAVISVAMLTACSGGSGSGGGNPVAPVTPSAFKNTKTYQLAQSGKGKSLYTEYYSATTNQDGSLELYSELVTKQGTANQNMYADLYDSDRLYATIVQHNGINYGVFYAVPAYDGPYNDYTEIAVLGGAEIPEGKTVCVDLNAIDRALSSSEPAHSTSGTDISGALDQINESKVTASTGVYKMPGTSQEYYAEIFTSKADPAHNVTYAYDNNDALKAIVSVDHDDVEALFFNKFEFDSPMFDAAKLNLSTYNAMDITDAYIAGCYHTAQ